MTRLRRKLPIGPSVLLFILFLVVALLTILALEYLEWRSGHDSLIFSHLIRLRSDSQQEAAIGQALKKILAQNQCDFQYVRERSGTLHFKVNADIERLGQLLSQVEKLAKDSGARLELADSQKENGRTLWLYQIHVKRKPRFILLLSSQERLSPPPPPPDKKRIPALPQIAIVIDDVGFVETVADQLHNLGIPITAAIIPEAPFAASQAIKIHGFGLEEIIHLPMQSKNNNHSEDEEEIITTSTPASEVVLFLQKARKIVPYALGVNNHMGSLITSRREWVLPVLQEVKVQNLFFLDSRTSADSIAFDVARELGIKTTFRDIFLDSVQTYAYAHEQVRQLVSVGQVKGEALAIGHPIPTTLEALRDSMEWLRSQRVEIVFASRLVK